MKRTAFKKQWGRTSNLKPKRNKYGAKKAWAHEGFLHVEQHPKFFRNFAGKKAEADYKEQMLTTGWLLFDSTAEANRFTHLKVLENNDHIGGLQTQQRMAIVVNDVFICDYILDFFYTMEGQLIGEDVKGFATETYQIKSKLFKALYPKIKFLEVPIKSVYRDPWDLLGVK